MEEIERKKYIKKCPICNKQISWIHGDKPDLCPHCNAVRWDKPKDEAILFNLQEKFKVNRDEKILGQMYLKMIPYAQKIINRQLGGTVRYDEERLEEKAQDSVTTVISYFLRRPNFYITESFGFQLLKAAQQQLYRKKQQDIDKKEFSYDAPVKEGEKNTFKEKITEDSIEAGNRYSQDILDISNRAFIIKELSDFIDSMYNSIAENRGIDTAILSMILLHHYLNKKKDSLFNDFYDHFGSELKESFELEKIILMEFLEELNMEL